MPIDRDAPTRRTFARLAALAGSGTLAGCAGLDALAGADRKGLTDARRERILDRYATGRAARRAASEHWAEGSDAWQLNYFGEAAAEWSRAGHRFAEAYRQFVRAGRDCRDAHAGRSEQVCASARDYCKHMRASAEAHAEAADAYEAGDLERGEAHLDRGWEQYLSALDHEVRGPADLEDALAADRRNADG